MTPEPLNKSLINWYPLETNPRPWREMQVVLDLPPLLVHPPARQALEDAIRDCQSPIPGYYHYDEHRTPHRTTARAKLGIPYQTRTVSHHFTDLHLTTESDPAVARARAPKLQPKRPPTNTPVLTAILICTNTPDGLRLKNDLANSRPTDPDEAQIHWAIHGYQRVHTPTRASGILRAQRALAAEKWPHLKRSYEDEDTPDIITYFRFIRINAIMGDGRAREEDYNFPDPADDYGRIFETDEQMDRYVRRVADEWNRNDNKRKEGS
jgi:hypothetical protein